MRIGATWLLEKYGHPLGVAKALLLNKLDSSEQEFVNDIVTKVILEAAKTQIEWERANKKTTRGGKR